MEERIKELELEIKRLRESKEKYKSIFENSLVGISLTGVDGSLYVNKAFSDILGYSIEELKMLKWHQITYPEDIKESSEIVEKLRSGKISSARYIKRYIHKSGDIVWADIDTMLQKDEEGQPKYFITNIIDISNRKKMEDIQLMQNTALANLNQFSIELSMLPSGENIEVLITKKIKEISGAKAAIFNEYNPIKKINTVRHIEMEAGLIEKVTSLLGKQIKEVHSPVSDASYQEIISQHIGVRKTLYEASFGAISRPVGAAIKAMLKVDRFIGLAYIYDGRLYGTTLLAMPEGQPDLPKQLLETFCYMAAVSLRRKHAEDALYESENKYRMIAENTADLIWSMDMNLKVTYISPSSFKIRGFTVEEAMMQTVDQIITPDSLQKAVTLFEEQLTLFKTTNPKEIPSVMLELEHYKKDGSIINTENSITLLLDSKRQAIGILGVTRDITARKKAEMNLHALSLRQEAILHAIPEIIMEVDAHKIYTWVNKNGLEFFGEDVIGREAAEYFEGEQDTYKNVETLFDGRENLVYLESWQRRKDGEKRLLAWYCSPLKDIHGNISGTLSSARDITNSKRAEEKILIQLEELRRWHEITVGREDRNRQLKHEVNELLIRFGETIRYPSVENASINEAPDAIR